MNYGTLMELFNGFTFFGWGEWSVDVAVNLTFVVLGLMATFLLPRLILGWFI